MMISANAGTVDNKDWAWWDPEGYSTTLKTYLKFVHAGYLGELTFIRGVFITDGTAQKNRGWSTQEVRKLDPPLRR
jgi:hypothetical protein